jgi:cell division protein FtsI (penicillin-binding protein 3)
MKNHKDISRRVRVLLIVMACWALAIGARLYFLQVVQSAEFRELAERQHQRVFQVTPRRGTIYDRNGNELASSIKVESVFAIPSEIKDPSRTAKTLAKLTGVSSADLIKRFDSNKSFVWVQRKISAADADAIERAKLPGVYFQKEDRRFYPKRELAAHVLGYVNVDEEGMGGLEYRYNDRVEGEKGKVVVMTDARGHSYYRLEQPPKTGASLVTTIDENIQYIVEKELQAAVAKTRPKGVSIIAMDPRSGEILAMANYPTFNPNEFAKYAPTNWTNRALSQVYEPGSTFKITTAAAALEENLTTPDELFDCGMGSIVLYGHRIRDTHKLGLASVTQIIQLSSNVGAIRIGQRVGEERFASYIDRLGFGKVTSIDLPGEERGLTKPVSRWSKLSLGEMSMGQEIGVTPLQVLSMVSAVANGGTLYRPFVVKKVQDPESGEEETQPQGRRVLSAATARQLQEMLEVVVTDGTAKDSKLDGYRAAGKTGTAQKIDETGRYGRGKYVGSFVGYAPASNPSLALIVVVDEPSGVYYGAQVAAPVFKNIAEGVLRYQSVAPDVPEYAPHYSAVAEQRQPAPAKAPARQTAPEWQEASFINGSAELGGEAFGNIIVPDFYGNSLRQVTEQVLKLGLKLKSAGSGRAAAQSPAPGAHVRAGTLVQVKFAARP